MTTATGLSELTGDYVLDSASTRIGFAVRAVVTKVRGQFDTVTGSARLDGADPRRSSVRLTIQAASIQTRNRRRDDHLRGHFLDAGRHPAITFTSTGVEQSGPARFIVTGDLTIRGVTRPVTVSFELTAGETDPAGRRRVSFAGRVTVSRQDWGVTWNAMLAGGGALISDKVTLEFEVTAVRTA
jgi:polyisoprenoid-binding protein YceI